MIIVQLTPTYTHGDDIKTLGRIFRGLERLEESGYTVERYECYPDGSSKRKYILRVEHEGEAEDATLTEWLTSQNKKPAGSGHTKNGKN